MNSVNINKSINICNCIVILIVISVSLINARLIRRPIHDEYGYGQDSYGAMGAPTGERAIIKVRGARHPIDGSAPQKLAIEDDPYRGPLPRGIYDNVDNYRGRADYPYGMMQQSSYGGLEDFFEPDFKIRAKVKVAGSKPSKCRFISNADSEIPELGLDSARLKIDCNLNPIRMANAALKVAKQYKKHRNSRQKKNKRGRAPDRSVRSNSKHRTTTIAINKNVVSKHHRQNDYD